MKLSYTTKLGATPALTYIYFVLGLHHAKIRIILRHGWVPNVPAPCAAVVSVCLMYVKRSTHDTAFLTELLFLVIEN